MSFTVLSMGLRNWWVSKLFGLVNSIRTMGKMLFMQKVLRPVTAKTFVGSCITEYLA